MGFCWEDVVLACESVRVGAALDRFCLPQVEACSFPSLLARFDALLEKRNESSFYFLAT